MPHVSGGRSGTAAAPELDGAGNGRRLSGREAEFDADGEEAELEGSWAGLADEGEAEDGGVGN